MCCGYEFSDVCLNHHLWLKNIWRNTPVKNYACMKDYYGKDKAKFCRLANIRSSMLVSLSAATVLEADSVVSGDGRKHTFTQEVDGYTFVIYKHRKDKRWMKGLDVHSWTKRSKNGAVPGNSLGDFTVLLNFRDENG